MLKKARMLNDLQELERNMNSIEAYYFSSLNLTNNQFSKQELYNKGNVEFELFKQRIRDLVVEVKNMNMKE